jgi:hypothetical protein
VKLRDALKVSEVEHALDSADVSIKAVGAKRPYSSVPVTAGGAVNPRHRRLLVATSMTNFLIVWEDSLKPVSASMRYYERDFQAQKLLDLDDWEPL